MAVGSEALEVWHERTTVGRGAPGIAGIGMSDAIGEVSRMDPTNVPHQQSRRGRSYKAGLLLVAGATTLSPLVGLVTAPIITHALGAAGRGAASATTAPNLFVLGVATLGLPEAVAFQVARHPAWTRRVTFVAALLVLPVAIAVVTAAWLFAPILSAGNADIVPLIRLCTAFAVPGVLVGIVRGAAIGRQLWTATALDRSLGSLLKLLSVCTLALTDALSVRNVALIWCITPMLTAVVFIRALRDPKCFGTAVAQPSLRGLRKDLLGFGSRVWLGDIATMMTARLAGLLVAPLSDLEQLGLLVVGTTISDVPYMLTASVREVAFGANSVERQDERLMATSRIMLLVTVAMCVPIAISLPWWIEPAFGADFGAALRPTWLLLLGTTISIPGVIAGAGLSSIAKPHLRSAAILSGLVTYAVLLVCLVPQLGATGAALGGLGSSIVTTIGCTWACRSALGVRLRDFFVPRKADIGTLAATGGSVLKRIAGARG